ncbi:MAG: alanine--tRNA ligase, partial [Bacillota bacterium]
MTGNELRSAFLKFFSDKDHLVLPSAPLVPEDDPTLLWINAGMAPFKKYFNGELTPPDTRVATSQKCIRTNDIENVGRTKRHHTFFEMLGNFSFGDYFKKEAITWAWEFVTEILELDPDRLWVTIYKEDEESFNIWTEHVGLTEERIIRMGKGENYWQIGTGPCGPCSEIHYDRGTEYGPGLKEDIASDGDRFLEIWNLVFTQYDYTEDGEYLPLPNKNIDTGMGLERVASILQDKPSNFETDLIKPIIDKLQEDTGIPYRESETTTTAYRVIADHIRAITMAIFDGVIPANEGRGYVIRRLLRRAVRFGGKLGYEEPFLYRLVPVVNKIMADGYSDLPEQKDHIMKVVRSEEESFFETLEQGLGILEEMIEELEKEEKDVLSGQQAFKLYDTYGFPLDLTQDVLKERGLEVDEEGFNQEMKKQKERARSAREKTGFGREESDKFYDKLKDEIENVEFIGYHNLEAETVIQSLVGNVSEKPRQVNELKQGAKGEVVIKRSPFYVEGGGQVGDRGLLVTETGKARVLDNYSRSELSLSKIEVVAGKIKSGQLAEVEVDEDKRKQTARNHSSTHLLHKALKEILGDHVQQSGSLVSPEKMRFDFTHYSALEPGEIKEIERMVNNSIRANYSVQTIQTTLDNARDMGAVALFDEKYGQLVRVVKMGDYSLELCGGTHVDSTGEIGLFKITSESSVAAGTRRIEAVTGDQAIKYVEGKEDILVQVAQKLNTEPDQLLEKVEQQQEKINQLENEITSLQDKMANYRSETLIEQLEEVDGIPLLTAELPDMDKHALRSLGDQIKMKLKSGIIILASNQVDKVIFLAMITDDLVEKGYHAGEIIGEVARITGGGGGGRPSMAQAGGTKPEKISEALDEVKNIIG